MPGSSLLAWTVLGLLLGTLAGAILLLLGLLARHLYDTQRWGDP